MKPVRVILNADAIMPPLTGIGRYAFELARGLENHAAIEDLKLYSIHQWIDDADAALAANAPFAKARKRVPFKTQALELSVRLRGALFRWHARRMRDYLLHTPNYILMPFDGPTATTVHDLSWIRYPQAHPVERVTFMNRHMARTLERANLVLTDSEFVAGEIVDVFAYPRERIRVVPLGVDAAYRPRSRHDILPTLAKHRLADSAYLLVVATQEPRKNLARLARAYAGLPAAMRARHPLVIAGGRGWLNDELERAIAPLESRGEARRLGYVDEAELPALYAGAFAFAFPSLYEGFGLPVLEALASGVPALTSRGSSLEEIARDEAGEVALCVNPLDEDALRDGLVRLLEDEHWRTQATTRGIAHARAFTWTRCIDATVAGYRSVIQAQS